MATYETALRDCLADAAALLRAKLEGKDYDQYGSYNGQVRAVLRDAELLRNREDCPTYDYKKGTP